MSCIQYQFYPKCNKVPKSLSEIPKIFEKNEEQITSSKNQLSSNEVLSVLADDIESLEYKVERSKKNEDKIRIPVLFGLNGSYEKYFDADCYNEKEKVVIEIEAGRAVTNYQFLKDLFQACVMQDVDYLVIAVRNTYLNKNDFEIVGNFMDTLYSSNRLSLPLKGVLIIGY